MQHGPKEKKERSLGERLNVKGERCASPKCAVVRKPYPPGVHGQKRRKALSEFGRQLKEKQKVKVSYGLNERGLRRLFEAAYKGKGSTVSELAELLERRLDNALFRLGFAASRSKARQMVAHGHILVNEKRVKSPSMLLRAGNVVRVRPESKEKGVFRGIRESLKNFEPPTWLELDKEKLEGKVLGNPSGVTVPFEINLLVESFSK